MKYFTAWHGVHNVIPTDMRQFLVFVRKEFHHIFRDTRTMMILLGMPVIQIILFGFAITTEVKNAEIAVLDLSKDEATRKIIEAIDVSDYFHVAEYVNNTEEIDKAFRKGKIGLTVIFGENFYENLLHTGKAQIQIIADATDPNTATTLTNYATAIINNYQQQLVSAGGAPYRIIPEVKLMYNPQMKGAYNFVPGVLGMILMLICAMMTSVAIVREKENGTMEVLLVSPMKPIFIILSKAVPYFAISAVNLATVLLLAVFVLKVPVMGSIFWLILVSLLFIFVSLAIGIMISTLTSKQMFAYLISGMVFMIPVMLLSGMIYPVENMPAILQWISHIIPAKWYIAAVKDLMIKGLGLQSVLKEITILLGMAAVIIAISVKKFKNRLE
jgi:ABC-2 type transport system permease protein